MTWKFNKTIVSVIYYAYTYHFMNFTRILYHTHVSVLLIPDNKYKRELFLLLEKMKNKLIVCIVAIYL